MAYTNLPTTDRCWVQCLFFPWRYPLTLVCLGFLLSVSSSLWPALEHLQRITTNDATVQLFLDENISAEQGRAFMQDLSNHPEVAHADFITREVAWRDFDETVALGTEPDDTPLPDIIVVELVPGAPVRDTIEKFSSMEPVRFVHTGWRWAERFNALKQIGLIFSSVTLITGLLLIRYTLSAHRVGGNPPVFGFTAGLTAGTLFGIYSVLISLGLSYLAFSYLSPLFPNSLLFHTLYSKPGWASALGVPMGLLGAALAYQRSPDPAGRPPGTLSRVWHSERKSANIDNKETKR